MSDLSNSFDDPRKRLSLNAEQRVRRLVEETRRSADTRRTRTRLTSIVGVVVAIACIVSLSAVTRLGHRLDTDAVAEIGRAELVAKMPATRAALTEHLEREAPQIVGASFDQLLQLVPEVGQMASAELHKHMAEINAEFEDRVVQLMAESIRSTQDRLAAAWPELNGAERVEQLVIAVTADFNSTFTEAIDALYPEYEAQMNQLRTRLITLRDADAEALSEEDRLQREIIETMLRLILREGVTHPG